MLSQLTTIIRKSMSWNINEIEIVYAKLVNNASKVSWIYFTT